MQVQALDSTNSPFSDDQAGRVNELVRGLEPGQLTWLSGYLAGVAQAAPVAAGTAPTAAAAEPARTLTVLYGSETGNAERLAERAAAAAAERDLAARVFDMSDYPTRELRDESLLLVISSTHGEGAPPDPAIGFYEHLHGRKAPKLTDARFAVLALGDSSYEFFCQTGRDFDARLEALGAERLVDRLDCDVDFEEAADAWLDRVLDAFAEHGRAGVEQPSPAAGNVVAFSRAPAPERPVHDRRNPFEAEVLENLVLNGRGSAKETRHVELSLEGSGIDYRPGDVLCLVPRNRTEMVSEVVERLGLDPTERVVTASGEMVLAEALETEYEITTLTPGFVANYAAHAEAHDLLELTHEDHRAELQRYMAGRQVVDVLDEHPVDDLDGAAFTAMLRRLQPREYSIASSHAACPEEVHLTVAAVRYESRGRARHGVASTYLADHVEPGDHVQVYIRPNKNFRLPEDPSTGLIMVGPGTGVAPFRAFMQEREVIGSGGPAWLFFGDQHFRTDFLYQVEWQRWLKQGVLDRLDVAFSRDQAEKVYVQQRMLERGAELYRWLEDGAHFYVCGDAERMAGDVHEALITLVAEHGHLERPAAAEYVKALQREKRYQRDVY